MKKDDELKELFTYSAEVNKDKLNIEGIIHRIAPTAQFSNPIKKNIDPKEAFKTLLIKGLNAQICLSHSDIFGRDTRINQRRWYFKTEDKKNWYVCIKYQNRSIPFLPNSQTALIVETLKEVEQIYTNFLQEVEQNDEFVNHLFELTKTLNIAKGRQAKA